MNEKVVLTLAVGGVWDDSVAPVEFIQSSLSMMRISQRQYYPMYHDGAVWYSYGRLVYEK